MPDITMIEYGNFNGTRALQVEHTNAHGEILQTLTDEKVSYVGNSCAKTKEGLSYWCRTPYPIEPDVQARIKKLRGVTKVYSL